MIAVAKRKTLFDDRPVEISVSPSAPPTETPPPPESRTARSAQNLFADISSYVSQELTYIIKQDIAHLNQQIAQLQTLTRASLQSSGKQVSEHNNNVLMMLQSKLADTSIGFKDVLEIRTQVSRTGRCLWGRCPRAAMRVAKRRLMRRRATAEHESEPGPDRAVHVHQSVPTPLGPLIR